MAGETLEITAARRLAAQASARLRDSQAFRELPAQQQQVLLNDLGTIQNVLSAPVSGPALGNDPYAMVLEEPRSRFDRFRRSQPPTPPQQNPQQPPTQRPRTPPATQAIAERTGALIDEVDFPGFVAGLVHGTFDAVVDASIRQMESFADLVSAVAKNATDFTRDNVTANQTRDWLVEQYPADIRLTLDPTPRLHPAPTADDDTRSPAWLSEYGLGGEDLSEELLEEQLIPLARERLGEDRLQMLATMVLLGMNRINVTDGSISARVRFRAQARDRTAVDFAVSQDPGSGGTWGRRGSPSTITHSTMVSTIGVNAQADAAVKAELFGEVTLNFASETLPLDRFLEQAQLALLQRNARVNPQNGQTATPSARAGSTTSTSDAATSENPTTEPPALPLPGPDQTRAGDT